MSWDLDGGNKIEYTRFPVGVTRIRVLSDAPHMRWVHWMPKFQRSVTCPGQGCPIDELRKQAKDNGQDYPYGMGKTFSMNIYNHESERYEIMEQGITFMQDLRDVMTDLKAEGKTLKDVTLRVRRRGTGKDDTSYRIDVDEEVEMNGAEKSAYASAKDLSEYFKPHTVEQITALLAVTADSPDKYREAWNEIMSGKEDGESTETDEEESIEVEA